jgi:HK97 family phage prohead protease
MEADTEIMDDILKCLPLRAPVGRWGIGLASQYLAGIKASDFGVDEEKWQKELKDAETRLTYCDSDFETKAFKEEGLTEGAILQFDGICSTKRKDRDGDVIESKGLELDHRMPLLWQHLQIQPVGKHLSLIEQSEKSWSSKWAIADTTLGRDAAILVKFGALRLSIGFKPLEIEPLSIEDDGVNKWVTGWHIKRAAVVETSLVSVPANADANILRVFEKEFDGICKALPKLKHDMVKHWAKSISDQRPVIVQGADLKTKETMGGELPAEKMEKCPACGEHSMDSTGTCTKCGHVKGKSTTVETKDAKEVETKGMSYYPKGSYEQIQYDLDRTARKYLKSKSSIDEDEYGWAYLYVTFSDKAIVCVRQDGDKTKCYSINYKVENGTAEWTGDPTEVDVEPAIISKAMAGKFHTKEFVTKEVEKEIVKEVEKELSFDELRKKFVSEAVKNGVEGYKALRQAADLYEAANFAKDAAILN